MATSLFSGLAEDFGKSLTPTDPVRWAWERAGIELWSKQRDIVYSVRDNKKTAVQSAHGTGKSLVAAVIAAWWIDTHPSHDTFVISTAPSKDQVSGILWENIRRIHRNAGLDGHVTLNDKWRAPSGDLVGQGRKPQDYQQSSFQGIHAKYVLFILDESCGIPEWIWTAAIANTSSDECRVLAIGNPDDPASEFARICQHDSSWNTMRISVWDSPNFSGEQVGQSVKEHVVQNSYVVDAENAWGKQSPLWTSKIEGLFPESNEFAVIPISWILAANDRWNNWNDNPPLPDPAFPARHIWGLDTARFGTDKSVLSQRDGNVFKRLESYAKLDTVDLTNKCTNVVNKRRDKIIIDMGGDSGSGVYDLLKRRGYSVEAFQPGARTKLTDVTRKLEFSRVRSAAWWKFRDALDPNKGSTVALPQVLENGKDLLAGDLTAPNWEWVLGDKIHVEAKDELRKRIGRSTDYADSVIQNWFAKNPVIQALDETAFKFQDSQLPGVFSWDEGGELDGFSFQGNNDYA